MEKIRTNKAKYVKKNIYLDIAMPWDLNCQMVQRHT